MAKTVYTPEEIEVDGTLFTIKPLPIAVLKRAMAALEESDKIESVPDSLDFILNVTKICIESQLPEDWELEDHLDIISGKRIIAVSTGIDLDAPNLVTGLEPLGPTST